MIIFQHDQTIRDDEFDVEDGGCAVICDFGGDDVVANMFVRVQSWDDDKQHEQFKKMIGHKVRVTVEILD